MMSVALTGHRVVFDMTLCLSLLTSCLKLKVDPFFSGSDIVLYCGILGAKLKVDLYSLCFLLCLMHIVCLVYLKENGLGSCRSDTVITVVYVLWYLGQP